MKRYPPPKQGPHTGWSPGRDRAAQAQFRKALIRRAGNQCEYVGWIEWLATEGRCPRRTNLHAHHDRAGYTADCGRLLCRDHHKAEDRHAR